MRNRKPKAPVVHEFNPNIKEEGNKLKDCDPSICNNSELMTDDYVYVDSVYGQCSSECVNRKTCNELLEALKNNDPTTSLELIDLLKSNQ